MEEITIDQLFHLWLSDVKEYGVSKYGAESRRELIESFCHLMKNNNISYSDAKFYKKKVIKELLTEDGLKGRGKYKGWKEIAEKEFDMMLSETYLSGVVNIQKATKEEKKIDFLTESDEEKSIKSFLRHKYGGYELLNEAKKVGSSVWVDWVNEKIFR